MIKKVIIFGFTSLFLFGTVLWARGDMTSAPTPAKESSWGDTLTMSYGQSKDNIDIYRIGLRKDFSTHWFESNVGYLSGYSEASFNYWNGRGNENFGIALSPVFVYYFNFSKDVHPYLEGGVGVSVFSRTTMGLRDLSTNFLFEDRLGTGIRVDDWDFSFRYMHYSNASIKQPNDGIDIFIGSISYKF